ncbi:ribonuclease P protein component [Herbihabitans rhizosphaerae]|uniref:ribonuclease P protein component n=1 Tax=Herbihabitans rhizosphaerae TaxID=1872711 RepID=UPI00102CBFDB|nr:ribonuclease P protein component [Herbihabitans rhizosphaerae]
MLPAPARLTSSEDFRSVTRSPRRAGRSLLVVHARLGDTDDQRELVQTTSPRVGFVVSKAVGNAVVRHRVSRRLRHLMRDRLGTLPAGAALVVRALPPSATASSRQLGKDIDAALRRLGLTGTDGGVE